MSSRSTPTKRNGTRPTSTSANNIMTLDPRITRTKMTVTEMQKQKRELEAYVSELVKKAELKQAELARVKMEMRRLKEANTESLDKLAQENEILRRKLMSQSDERISKQLNIGIDSITPDEPGNHVFLGTGLPVPPTYVRVGARPGNIRCFLHNII